MLELVWLRMRHTPYETWARSVVDAWATPSKLPRIATLDYMAEAAYYAATTLHGFTGSLEAWQALCHQLHAGATVAVAAPPAPAAPAAPPEDDVLMLLKPRSK